MIEGSSSAELIREIGEALFGSQWQGELAGHLGINRRTVQRWQSGRNEPQPGVWDDLEALLSDRASAAMRLCETVRKRRAGESNS